jgi:hypothetical protein
MDFYDFVILMAFLVFGVYVQVLHKSWRLDIRYEDVTRVPAFRIPIRYGVIILALWMG